MVPSPAAPVGSLGADACACQTASMAHRWIHESPAYWDAPKAEIIGAAPEGTFGARGYEKLDPGALVPCDWWRVEDEASGDVVGYGWMDITWGDGEILLAVHPKKRGEGVGTFILDRLEAEARERGLNYLYNVVPENHPEAEAISAWLEARRFQQSEDGKLHRAVIVGK